MEQGPSTQCRSEAAGFEEARVEGRCPEERCHEFAWFVVSILPFPFTVRDLPTPVKASVSQRQDWRLSDEEIIPQVRWAIVSRRHRQIPTLTVSRAIMLAGHETTAKAVEILSSAHHLSIVLTTL